jgi:GT2 family glycosyltransferase
MLISIITINYKKKDLTIACLKSLQDKFKNEFSQDQMEIIIIDNASKDDSVDSIKNYIKEHSYKNSVIVESKENGGFGKGNNLGVKDARGDFLVFLNNDTTAKDDGILRMAKYLRDHSDISILGGQLRNTDGSVQVSVGSFYSLPKVVLLLLGMQRFGVIDKNPTIIKQVDWVKGGLLMIRKEIFEKLNGFDEKIFMYTEDMELCYRAKLQGFKTYFYPDVEVLHAEHGSTNRTFAIVNIYKNLLYFYKKHKSIAEFLILKIILTIKAVFLIVIGKLIGSSYLSKTYSEALRSI